MLLRSAFVGPGAATRLPVVGLYDATRDLFRRGALARLQPLHNVS